MWAGLIMTIYGAHCTGYTASLLPFLMILGDRQSEREPCELDLKTRAVRLPVIKAVSCKIK